MKRSIAIILLAVFMLSALSSCGGVPDFVPVEKDSVESLNWILGGKKDINIEEYYSLFEEAYNSVKETEEYEDRDAEWSFVAISKEGEDKVSSYVISYLGEDRFNVSISGKTSSEEGPVRYSVVNSALASFAHDKFFKFDNYTVKATVKFVISAGVPTDGGTVRTEDEVLNESEQTLSGSELSVPTVSNAVIQALMVERFTDDYKLSKDGTRITGLNGYEEKTEEKADSVDMYYWDVLINGELTAKDDVGTTAVADGDEITVVYVLRHPGE